MVQSHTRLLPLIGAVFTAFAAAEPMPPTSVADGESCTSTTVVPAKDAPSPPSTYEPTWVITKYTTTSTAHTGVDCGGCASLLTNTAYINYLYPEGPSPPVITTITATEPQIVTKAHCNGATAAKPAEDGIKETPGPAMMPARMNGGGGEDAGSDCTKFFPHADGFTFGPVSTVWTTTTTVTEQFDCGSCRAIRPNIIPLGPGPVIFFTTTVTAEGPSTTYEAACGTGANLPRAFDKREIDAMSDRPRYYEAPPFTVKTAIPQGAKATCTSQFVLEPEIPGSTSTVYPSTVTSTTSIDCDGCMVEWSTGVINFFAPILITKTVTVDRPSTSRVVACAAKTA